MGDARLTPDFAALFEKQYAIIGEFKRTFPEEDIPFRKEIEQLLKYDKPLPFALENGEFITPTIQDIVLVINADNSAEIASRINGLVREQGYSFQNNLILMEYHFNSGDRVSRYTIRKFQGENRRFRDTCLPPEVRLETNLGDRHKSIRVKVAQFMPYKLKEVLCNDSPPAIYLATHFWTDIFPTLLSTEQLQTWARKNPQKIMPVEIDVGELTTALNHDYWPDVRVRSDWTRSGLDFLVAAGLASVSVTGKYTVRFSNRAARFGARTFGEPEEIEHDVSRECAEMLADEYCRSTTGLHEKPGKPLGRYRTSSRKSRAKAKHVRTGRQRKIDEAGKSSDSKASST